MSAPPPEMPCQEVVEVVTDYIEGALSEEDRIRFEEHLAVCSKCVEYVEQFRRTIALVGRVEERDLDPAARDGLVAAFRDWARS